jgi:two-component sensor histidine kinase
VPLSLLLTEAVTNALKYCGNAADGEPTWIRVCLGHDSGDVTLAVTNSVPERTAKQPDEDDISSTGLGGELIGAFAMQLGGQLRQGRVHEGDARGWELRLSFRLDHDENSDDAAAAAARPTRA